MISKQDFILTNSGTSKNNQSISIHGIHDVSADKVGRENLNGNSIP